MAGRESTRSSQGNGTLSQLTRISHHLGDDHNSDDHDQPPPRTGSIASQTSELNEPPKSTGSITRNSSLKSSSVSSTSTAHNNSQSPSSSILKSEDRRSKSSNGFDEDDGDDYDNEYDETENDDDDDDDGYDDYEEYDSYDGGTDPSSVEYNSSSVNNVRTMSRLEVHKIKLSKFCLRLYESDILTDMLICIDCITFKVHKIIMACHSQYFCDLLLENYKTCPNGSSIYNIGCVSASVFKEVLNYTYSGDILLDKVTLTELYMAAELFQMGGLQELTCDMMAYQYAQNNPPSLGYYTYSGSPPPSTSGPFTASDYFHSDPTSYSGRGSGSRTQSGSNNNQWMRRRGGMNPRGRGASRNNNAPATRPIRRHQHVVDIHQDPRKVSFRRKWASHSSITPTV